MNDKKTITVEIPILDNVEELKVVETFTEEQLWYVCAIAKAFDKLQSNWNSLRECIIGVIEGAREELNTIIHTTDINTKEGLEYVNQCSREFDVIRKNLEIVLDKMNELESKDNNGKN